VGERDGDFRVGGERTRKLSQQNPFLIQIDRLNEGHKTSGTGNQQSCFRKERDSKDSGEVHAEAARRKKEFLRDGTMKI